jgi:beta-glucanase (GH16 family)
MNNQNDTIPVVPVAGHEPSFLPAGLDFQLVWNDEFDGLELDRSKWDFRLSMMGRRHPAWVDHGVRLDGRGNVIFDLLVEDGRPVSAQLQTGYNFMDEPVQQTTFLNDHLQWNIGKLHRDKFTHCYGYYECRCRLQSRTDAWWSAFWMQSPVIGASLDPAETGSELDIMECFASGEIVPHNAFTGGYGLDCKRMSVGGVRGLDPAAFHRFGMLWDEGGYTFYVDGKEDGRITDYVSKRPEFILISTEVKGYRYESHQPVPAAFDAAGDTFVVDYVRVFDAIR